MLLQWTYFLFIEGQSYGDDPKVRISLNYLFRVIGWWLEYWRGNGPPLPSPLLVLLESYFCSAVPSSSCIPITTLLGCFILQAFRAQNIESAKSRLSVCAEDIREQLERMGTTSELCSQLGAVLGMLGDCWSVLFLLLCNVCIICFDSMHSTRCPNWDTRVPSMSPSWTFVGVYNWIPHLACPIRSPACPRRVQRHVGAS